MKAGECVPGSGFLVPGGPEGEVDAGRVYAQRWMAEADAQLREYVESFVKAGHRFAAFRTPEGRFQCGWRHARGRFRDVWGNRTETPLEALRSATRAFDQVYRAGTDRDRVLNGPPPAGSVPWGEDGGWETPAPCPSPSRLCFTEVGRWRE